MEELQTTIQQQHQWNSYRSIFQLSPIANLLEKLKLPSARKQFNWSNIKSSIASTPDAHMIKQTLRVKSLRHRQPELSTKPHPTMHFTNPIYKDGSPTTFQDGKPKSVSEEPNPTSTCVTSINAVDCTPLPTSKNILKLCHLLSRHLQIV